MLFSSSQVDDPHKRVCQRRTRQVFLGHRKRYTDGDPLKHEYSVAAVDKVLFALVTRQAIQVAGNGQGGITASTVENCAATVQDVVDGGYLSSNDDLRECMLDAIRFIRYLGAFSGDQRVEIDQLKAEQPVSRLPEETAAMNPRGDIVKKVAEILADDPACGGRVTTGSIEAIASLVTPEPQTFDGMKRT